MHEHPREGEQADASQGWAATVRNQPSAHDSRHGAGMSREQRHEGLPGQAEARHHPVHREGGSREIARVFQQAGEEEQEANLREEHDRAAQAAHDTLRRQLADRPGRQHLGQRGIRRSRTAPRSGPSGTAANVNSVQKSEHITAMKAAIPYSGCVR